MAIVWLDSGIIGLITNPHKQGEAGACERWLLGLAALQDLSRLFLTMRL